MQKKMSSECKEATKKLQDTMHSILYGTPYLLMPQRYQSRLKDIEKALLDGADCSSICEAMERGYLEVVQFLIDKGADVDSITSNGHTPLTFCINKKIKNSAICLLKAGVNVCRPNKDNKTPLSVAVLNQDLKMIQFLLDNGANFNIQTAFLDAIQTKNLEIVEFFIAKGASVNFRYIDGDTPLIAAIKARKVSIVEKLFDEGANVNIPGTSGTYPLVQSVEMHRFGMLKIIVEESKQPVDFGVINNCGHTALTKAIAKDNFEPVRYLVEHGADVNQIDNNQKTPLSIAAANFNIRSFEFLIKSGANVESSLPQIEEVAKNNDDFSAYFQEISKTLQKKRVQKDIVNLVGDAGHEEASPF